MQAPKSRNKNCSNLQWRKIAYRIVKVNSNGKKMIILGIESSCDETAAAVVEKKTTGFLVRSSVIASQIKIHARYGGVVPEVAARNHVEKIIPVIATALRQAHITPRALDRIAVTAGPGLITSLLVGTQAARTLAYVWQKPIVPVNHLRAHVYAAWLPTIGELRITNYELRKRKNPQSAICNPTIKFPAVALVVSGGHTELVLMKNAKSFRLIGATLDDAAGEAFDKVGKILGLPYPGGPAVSKAAEHGNPLAVAFPRPMENSHDFNFSFSGLKTAVRYHVRDQQLRGNERANIAASFQKTVVDTLVPKTIAAAKKYGARTVILGGGVAANKPLRKQLQIAVETLGIAFVVPDFSYCTDNAAMVAIAGYFGKPVPWKKIRVGANRSVENV